MFEQICSVWRRGLLLWFKHICMRASHLWHWPCALCRAACRSAARPLRSAYRPPNLHDTAGAVSHTNAIKHIFKLHSLCNSLLMAASVTHFHFFISALGKLVNLISTQADNGELGGRNVTPSTTANHQSPVKYREEERRHALCFKGSLKLIAVIATFPKFSKLFSLFSSLILTVSCEGLQLYTSVKVLVLFLCWFMVRSTPPPGVYFTRSLASSSCIKDLPLSGLIFSLAVILMPIPSCTERTGRGRKV